MSKLRPHLTYANVVSSVCLFIVLGGSAYAATVITGKNVKDGSLTGKDVKNKSLTRKDFRGSVRGPKGDTGPQGPKGDTGLEGPKGDPGPADVKPLAAVVNPGVSNQVAGELGPVKVLVSCPTGGGFDQAITVTGTSSVGGVWNSADFNSQSHSTVSNEANQSVSLLANSLEVNNVGFVFEGTNVRVAGNFMAGYSPDGTGCRLAGTLTG